MTAYGFKTNKTQDKIWCTFDNSEQERVSSIQLSKKGGGGIGVFKKNLNPFLKNVPPQICANHVQSKGLMVGVSVTSTEGEISG